jgi:hypothetical protein
MKTEVERLHEDLMEVAAYWLRLRVRGDFVGMRHAAARMEELCAEIEREEKRAGAA